MVGPPGGTHAERTDSDQAHLVERICDRYGQPARQVLDDDTAGCCGTQHSDPIARDLDTADETGVLPRAAAGASLGCGNPSALIDLHDGEVVLDLGPGGGIETSGVFSRR